MKYDCVLHSIMPHMHLLGREMKVTATLPDGTLLPLVHVNNWDFNWQTGYQFKTPLHLPAGSRVDLEARYDNSSAIALYESSGFRQFGEHARYYADGATALRYEKSLIPASRRETGNNPPPEGVRPLRGASRPR